MMFIREPRGVRLSQNMHGTLSREPAVPSAVPRNLFGCELPDFTSGKSSTAQKRYHIGVKGSFKHVKLSASYTVLR